MGGFTLTELVLALVVIGIATAIVLPNFASMTAGAGLDSASRNTMSLVKFTRSTSVTKHWNCKLEWNPQVRRWRVIAEQKPTEEPGQYTEVDVPAGIRDLVPDGVDVLPLRVYRFGIEQEDATEIHFRPDGTADEALIYFMNEDEKVHTVAVIPMTGQAVLARFPAENIYQATQDYYVEE